MTSHSLFALPAGYRRRSRSKPLVGLLLPFFLGVPLAACSNSDGAESVRAEGTRSETDQQQVTLRLDRGEIEIGGSFTVTFERVADDGRSLVLGPGLSLQRGEQELNTLVVRDVFPPEGGLPAVLPPDSPLPDREMLGNGPFRFELPKTEKGDYQVCARVLLTGRDSDLEEFDVCREFVVV